MARPNWEYIRVDVLLPQHHKLDGLSAAAKWTLLELWLHCGQHLTDGYVRDAVWRKTGSAASRAKLVEHNLAEPVDGGYQMHDYLEHQRSRAEVEELKKKRAEAGSRGGKAKALATANAIASATASASPEEAAGDNFRLELDSNSAEISAKLDRDLEKTAARNGTRFSAENRRSEAVDPKQMPQQVLYQNSSKAVAEAEAEAEADKSVADVVNQSNGSRQPGDDIRLMIIQEIRNATGRHVTEEWADRIRDHVLAGRSPADPAAYVRQAIRNDPDPRKRFLPLY